MRAKNTLLAAGHFVCIIPIKKRGGGIGRVKCKLLTLDEGHDSMDVVSSYCLDGERPGSGVLPVTGQQDVRHGLKRIKIDRLPWVAVDISLKKKQANKQTK